MPPLPAGRRIDAALLSRAFEQAHEAFIAVDAGGVIAAWSPGAERLYGYTAAEAMGQPLALLCFSGEDADLAAPARSPAGGGDRPPELIRRHRAKSGQELWVALRPSRLELPGGAPGLLLCALDVSLRRSVESDLAASREDLAAGRSELRRSTARMFAAEEEARRRIARELHDDLGQRLVGLTLALKAERQGLPEGEPRSTALDGVARGLAELAADLARLSHTLHPSALAHRGLVEALGDLCAEVERRSGLAVGLGLATAPGPLPPEVSLGLYRIAQEALANAVRHAGARAIRLTLVVEPGSARLAVADDGVGFDLETARRSGRLGLASVEERAGLLGGSCRITTAPGAGTEVEVSVPLPLPALAQEEPGGGEPPTRHVGPYRLVEEIGRGAMATVYLAEEPRPLGRRVALKLHRRPLPGNRETLRFKAEQQALARLHHPAVAGVHEARTTEDGDLYIVMEYVPGLPITEHCDRYGLGLERRLELFAAVCAGVQHAHQKGVVHRDLKPANLLIMEEGGTALPKIIDFGVAKGLDRPLVEGTVWTTAGELVGTPAYLAPEVLGGGEADTRSDLFGLGAVLYELLVGSVPIEPRGEGVAGLADWVAAMRRGDVSPPSRRLRAMSATAAATVARRRGFDDPSRLARRLAGDLDRMVLKAVAADPAARYPTVAALGEEVERVLRGEPVEAGPQGALQELGRQMRRHRRLVAAVALVILALAGGLVATVFQARLAEREAARADAVAGFLEDLFRASDPRLARGAPPDARELLRRGAERIDSELHDQPLTQARLLDTLGGIDTELGLFDEARPLLEQALALRERLLGGGDLEVAATLVRLGTLAHLSGHPSSGGDAEALFRRALAIREARLGTADPAVADLLNKLGAVLAARGRFDEAEATLRRALTLDERLWGSEDPRVAKVLHNLSGIAFYRGRTEEAEKLLERALAIREKALPEDDPDLAGSREALALLRQQQGRPAEAAALLERLVATDERIYGSEHPVLARALLNLGLARDDLGESETARRLLERALAMAEKTVAPDHPLLIRALAALADLELRQGRYAAAEPRFKRLLGLRQAGGVYDHWDRVLAGWASLLRATGRPGEAAEVEARAAAGR